MRALKWLGGTVAVLFVVIALFFTFGLNLLKGPITRAVSESLGRELVIEGDLRPVWSWVHPRLRAEGVTFANADWGKADYLLNAEVVEASISVLPLLAGRVVLPEVHLQGAELSLEQDADGRKNWILKEEPDEQKKPSRLFIKLLTVDEGRLRWEDAWREHSFVADLSSRDEADALFPAVVASFGRLDILVNNAGICPRKPAAEHDDEMWDRVLEVNLTSVFRLSRAAGRHMLERGEGGKIINVASLLSFQGGITVPSYAASKGGVGQLTKALSNEWAVHRINVNAIAPGYIKTDTTAALQVDSTRSRQILERIPAGRWGEPQDVAGAAVFLASRASDYVHGHLLVVDGGWLGR